MYRLVTEVTHDALWEWDLEDKTLFWIDGGHHRLFGYTIENFLLPQAFWEACIHPDDVGRVLRGLENKNRKKDQDLGKDTGLKSQMVNLLLFMIAAI